MSHDIYHLLQSSPRFRQKVQDASLVIGELEQKADKHPKYRPQFHNAISEYLELCGYNLGMLTGYFFPKYPKDQPMTLMDRPFAFSMFEIQIGGYIVIKGSRQIGKSTTIGSRDLMLSHLIPGFSSFFITPHSEQLKTYADRLMEMSRAFRFPLRDNNFRQNLFYKEFPNGSKIKLAHVLTTADPVRGNSGDQIIIDEYQGFDIDLEPEVKMIQKASDMPITLYLGTSLSTDTALEYRYNESSRGMWMIKDPSSGVWINTHDKSIMDRIQPEGLIGDNGRPLDVTQGMYVHESIDRLNDGKVGYHVPQIIIPFFAHHPMRWAEIYDQKVEFDERKFLQEVLGIATEEGEKEITIKELEAICIHDRKELINRAKGSSYKYIVSGCDWGGSDYNPTLKTKLSFTVHAVLGIKTNGDMEIIHMRKYSSMNYDEIIGDITSVHKELNGYGIGTDFGVGQHYNYQVREILHNPHRHVIFGYVGPRSSVLAKPPKSELFNHYSLNKTESISSLFSFIKKGRMTCYNWKEASVYLQDFMNLRRAVSETAGGLSTFTYQRNPSKADDTLHAINFAYTLGRILMGENLVEDRSLKEHILKTLYGSAGSANHSIMRRSPGGYISG